MTKRITALLIAVIIPITMIFTGCGSKQLSTQEYYDKMLANFKEYSAAVQELAPLTSQATTASAAQANQKKAEEICGNAEKALDKFVKMNPPAQFADKHKKLVTAIDNEKDFLNATKKLFAAKSESDITSATSELAAVQNKPADQQFASVYLDLFKEVKTAADNS